MTYKEVNQLDRCELVYNVLLCKSVYYRWTIQKLTLHRKHNCKGRLIADFIFYLYDKDDNVHVEKYRVYDDEYIWLCTAITNDFPDLDFLDITDESEKPKNV